MEYKIKEAEGLDGTLTELSSDKEGVQSEHDAIHSYLGELEKQCVVVPETYAERKGHHEAEIAGLKEALSILSEGSYISILLLESLCTCFTVTNDHGSHDKNAK